MKKLCIKSLFIIVMILSLALHTGCSMYINEVGDIVLDFDRENDKGNGENKETSSSEKEEDEPGTLPDSGSPIFSLNSYITQEKTIVETEHFKFEIEKNIFVPGYLEEYIEIIYDALETVSGLSFYNEIYNPGKITVEVEKPYNEEFPESELGPAYAYSKGSKLHVCAGDLLLGNTYAITHELAHILQYSQSSWSYSQVYVEGFAEYTSHKAVKYLETNNIAAAYLNGPSNSHVNSMEITGDLYSQTIEYWIENPKAAYDISFNGGYSVGFRFMSYLDHVYGNYSSWIKYYENINPYHTNKNVNQEIGLANQFKAMKETYGSNVFDNFYTWVKNNGDLFKRNYNFVYDLSKLNKVTIYPHFSAIGDQIAFKGGTFKYSDLYINIDEARNYLIYYKNKNVTTFNLELLVDAEVELYDSKGQLLSTGIGRKFSLDGVSYIRLVGGGTLGQSLDNRLKIVYED